MPNRIIRDRILSSESLAALSHPAERLFYRLVVLVDDHGRFHGSPQYVRHAAMPLLDVSVPDVGRWLSELEAAGVVCLYEADGRRYLQFKNWPRYQRLRAKDSKYPQHTSCICGQMRAVAVKCLPESESESESESEVKILGGKPPEVAARDVLAEEFEKEIRPAYPRRDGDQRWVQALSSYRVARRSGESFEVMRDGLGRYVQWCLQRGIVGTASVKQAASFFGREKCWQEPWVVTGVQKPNGCRKLKLVSGRVISVASGKRITYTDAPDACDAYELPNGTLSVKSGAQWVNA